MKKSKRVYAKPIEENGTINAFSTAANVDWIRSARLQKKVDAGDTEAKRELEELNALKFYDEILS